jgi:hypothetical protein
MLGRGVTDAVYGVPAVTEFDPVIVGATGGGTTVIVLLPVALSPAAFVSVAEIVKGSVAAVNCVEGPFADPVREPPATAHVYVMSGLGVTEAA